MTQKQAKELTIRDASADDAQIIADIYNESIVARDSTLDDEPKSVDDIRGWFAGFNERETILLLEDNGQVLGWGSIRRYTERSGYRYCCETAVYLRRALIRQGYGTLLKKALIDRCKQYGYHHLHAKIFAENVASIEYNKQFGYEVVGIQSEIGYQQGLWKDVAILQLILPDSDSQTAPPPADSTQKNA